MTIHPIRLTTAHSKIDEILAVTVQVRRAFHQPDSRVGGLGKRTDHGKEFLDRVALVVAGGWRSALAESARW
ncbi:MAG: hypothetical protein ACREK6_00615 [Candidatus Rokuibacteriota bacterium]